MLKTWEVYKMALENPKAKFKRLAHKETFELNEKGQLISIFSDAAKTDYACPKIDEEWELVREPVDFMAAIKAYANGKRIRVVWSSDERIYGTKDKAYPILDNKGEGISVEEILDGKWFIE